MRKIVIMYFRNQISNSRFRTAVRAVNKGERGENGRSALSDARRGSFFVGGILQRIEANDPFSGQGEFHLNTMKWRIEHNDKIQIEFYAPKIPYRETITKYAQADYRHKKQSGGAGQLGSTYGHRTL